MGRDFLISNILENTGIVRHFFGTKSMRDLKSVSAAFEIDYTEVLTVNQRHTNEVLTISQDNGDLRFLKSGLLKKPYDAIVTNRERLGIGVYTADCVPILLVDPVKRVIAAVHAGWKGTIYRITQMVISSMCDNFKSSPSDIMVAVGPSIRECCYEVDSVVIDPLRTEVPLWDRYIIPREEGKWMLDLQGLNIGLLREGGILEGNIEVIELCTRCRPDLFHSYRRDGKGTGKMISLIMLEKGSEHSR